ncbi:MAG: ABC transporter ATP-binding protein [Bacteroidetes bacterium]|nr:ABC transporter ATP-binding protein [Bacteroidota bacterium]
MITINDLTFWYSKQNRIFENLNLELDTGHIYGLLGKNGAGKTTLLKLICGLSFPKSGSVDIDRLIPLQRKPGLLANIFFVPEEISVPSHTMEKFADIHGGFYPAFDPVRLREFLEKFEVNADQNFSGMSHGQKKKGMIAFALAANTRYLFLDEPTNGLDIPSKAAFRSMLAASFSEEKTIILSTHMVRDLESLIDSVIILNNRKIILNRTMDQISHRLTFSHSSVSSSPGEMIYSAKSELGPAMVSMNTSGIEGKVDLETLFNTCINIPDKISYCFEN